jgi:hypothetical protein
MRRTRTWYSVSAPAEFNWRVISLFRQIGVIGLQRSNIDQSGGRAFGLQSCARGIKHDKLRLLIDKNAAASRGERASGSIPDMAIPDQGLPTVYRMIERPASNAIAARAPLQWEKKRGVRRAPVNETAPLRRGRPRLPATIFYKVARAPTTGYFEVLSSSIFVIGSELQRKFSVSAIGGVSMSESNSYRRD